MKRVKNHTAEEKRTLFSSAFYEYKKAIASTYLLLILGILPLYMRDGLKQIGDAKYLFYRNISVLIFLLAVVGLLFVRKGPEKIAFSLTDKWALLFGGISVLTCFLSDYREIALWGYPDWHMGLLTQLLLVFGYFMASKWYDGDESVRNLAALSAGMVSLLGVVNRLGKDPLRVFSEISWTDWNRRNLLATIGNINWYCSYLCVMLPLLIALFWSGGKKTRIFAGVGSFFGVASLMTQGSESGFAGLGALLFVLFFMALENRERFIRFWEVLFLPPLACISVQFYHLFTGNGLLLDEQTVSDILYSRGWWYLLAVFSVGKLVLVWRKKQGYRDWLEDGRCAKIIKTIMVAIPVISIAIVLGCQISKPLWTLLGSREILRLDDDWGGERGYLWRVSWECFWEGSWKQKLFGAGPDCYAHYIYERRTMNMAVSGQWAGAVFANAHNEWLNMLINEGILGVTAYIGFFASAFVRFFRKSRKCPWVAAGVMAIAAYAANNFFSFQQTVSTPLLFLLIGMCEQECNKEKTAEQNVCAGSLGTEEKI